MSTNRMAMLEPEEATPSNGRRPAPSPNGKIGGGSPAAPSPNGNCGVGAGPTATENPDVQPKPQPGRDAHGRFVKGNTGGPGNPFGRQVAALRQLALDAVPAERIRAIFSKLTELALEGNVPAAKLVLSYTVGKPAPAPDPDRVDLDEWQQFKETAPMMRELGEVLTPNPIVPLACARAGRFAKTETQSSLIVQLMTAPDGGRAQMDEMLKARAAANDPPAEEEEDAPPPSPNGKVGAEAADDSRLDRADESAPEEAPVESADGAPAVDNQVGEEYSSHEVEAAMQNLETLLASASRSNSDGPTAIVPTTPR